MTPASSQRPREDRYPKGRRPLAGFVRKANRALCHRQTAQCSHITNMNQSWVTDSNVSLDVGGLTRESGLMVTQPYQLYIERTDPSKNMARFYAMSIEPTLFGDTCLTRRWGRIGADGQKKVHHFAREQDAVVLFLDLVRQKRSRGYSTVRRVAHATP